MIDHSLTDDQVVYLYLSGFMSGIASILVNEGVPSDEAYAFARGKTKYITDDPIAYHQLSDQLMTWLVERPNTPQSATIVAYTEPS